MRSEMDGSDAAEQANAAGRANAAEQVGAAEQANAAGRANPGQRPNRNVARGGSDAGAAGSDRDADVRRAGL